MRKPAMLFFVLTALTACGGDTGTRVEMTGHEFDPRSLTVPAGATVVWANGTDESHTVTAVDDSLPEGADYFSSGDFASESDANADVAAALIDPEDAYEWTFEQPGTYRYYCIPHRGEGMEGTIVVEE